MNEKAIVIGASMSGLLAARVLSDFYDEVVILERDTFSDQIENRRGVPQGQHAHAILSGGSQALERQFSGITQELINSGAILGDAANDGRWFFEGAALKRAPSSSRAIMSSRPLLEGTIRKRVRSLKGVTILEGRSVQHLHYSGGRVKGVRTGNEILNADLVIDASGRGSQSAKWLEWLRFPVPRKEMVEIDVAYTTRLFRRRATDINGDLFAVVPATPETPNSGVVLAQEGDRWIATMIGRFGQQPPTALDEFIGFAKRLNDPYIFQAIRHAEPIGDAMTMRFPASIRRRFEDVPKSPTGFLVFGDAICSFNPVYAQGMTLAALQADALSEQLSKGGGDLAKRFYRAAAKVIDNPWSMAVGSDLMLPGTKGRRPLGARLMGRYIARLHKLGHHDADAAQAFLRVTQLLDEPSSLMRPSLALRVLLGNRRSGNRENGSLVKRRRAEA
jgi:2-polyprenyl-6-methoxyphenol hydroxylase-like FAD-dependent oxidoreductase